VDGSSENCRNVIIIVTFLFTLTLIFLKLQTAIRLQMYSKEGAVLWYCETNTIRNIFYIFSHYRKGMGRYDRFFQIEQVWVD